MWRLYENSGARNEIIGNIGGGRNGGNDVKIEMAIVMAKKKKLARKMWCSSKIWRRRREEKAVSSNVKSQYLANSEEISSKWRLIESGSAKWVK
jgi:hypothetical protein